MASPIIHSAVIILFYAASIHFPIFAQANDQKHYVKVKTELEKALSLHGQQKDTKKSKVWVTLVFSLIQLERLSGNEVRARKYFEICRESCLDAAEPMEKLRFKMWACIGMNDLKACRNQ